MDHRKNLLIWSAVGVGGLGLVKMIEAHKAGSTEAIKSGILGAIAESLKSTQNNQNPLLAAAARGAAQLAHQAALEAFNERRRLVAVQLIRPEARLPDPNPQPDDIIRDAEFTLIKDEH